MGGPGRVVEVDEVKFLKRKNNEGRIIDGAWVFVGFKQETKRILMVPFPDRTKETLLKAIQEWIKTETHIISDGWAAYHHLKEERYSHEVVNNSEYFVDPKVSGVTLIPKSQNKVDERPILDNISLCISSAASFYASKTDSTFSGKV